jgi:AraC family transcriptional regulator
MDSSSSLQSSPDNNEYTKRVNRGLDYLNVHYAEPVSLESLALLANFSPYHFHRIFKGVVGESLYKYIQRIRIEKAAHAVQFFPTKPLTDIALECGFSNSAVFARTFKEYFSMTATQWRNGGHQSFRKNWQVLSKNREQPSIDWQVKSISALYIDGSNNNAKWDVYMMNLSTLQVEVKQLPETTVAYIRHIGAFAGEQATWARLFQTLTQWGAARNLLRCPGTDYYTVFRDDVNITEFSKFKCDLSISVPKGTQPEGQVGVSVIAAGQYAVAQFEIDAHEYPSAWELIYGQWLPQSGFQPSGDFCFERYLNDPNMHPSKKHIIEVCIPVKGL